MKKIIASGKRGKTNQAVLLCANTISVKFREPAMVITGISTKLIETS